MQRAFTLVELLVTLSIISMLASIVMVRVSVAQANARDVTRTQQIKQIDLAVKMYIQDKGHAPLLSTGLSTNCDIQSQTPTAFEKVSACFAVSTAAIDSPQWIAWNTFKNELIDYIKVPDDPCSSCNSLSVFPIGYTYVAPLATQYYCSSVINGIGCPASRSSYQTYAPLERKTEIAGNGDSTNNYAMSSGGLPPNSVITITRINGRVLTYQETNAPIVGNTSGCVITHYTAQYVAGSNTGPYCSFVFTNQEPNSGHNIVWVSGSFPNGANTSIPPTITPQYGSFGNGNNNPPLEFHIDFQ